MAPAAESANPALTAFIGQIGTEIGAELTLAQIVIWRAGNAFELRHVADRDAAGSSLRLVTTPELRELARYTLTGQFRPLKSAPTLVTGWRATMAHAAELGLALDQLYPGAIADWFAARGTDPPITSYRKFTARQTGMYRITTLLDDPGVAGVIRACCNPQACLKRRLWSVEGVAPDDASQKSLIPCLEPCALLLDMARKAVRQEQQIEPNPGDQRSAS